ncbi:hypothetical protein Scep_012717 [Stephania cephalantha]|uniref:C3H1-type domain-containing protein n=1 Tax=Stephania cephalantha TaxID=152367 RepID=A0AAP0JFX3_9MAGN
MPDNWKFQSNGVATSSHASAENLEEGMWNLKIQTQDGQDGVAARANSPYPDRPGEPDCIYYLRTGVCGYGSSCRYNHPAYSAQGASYRVELPERVGEPDCQYFLKTGVCKFGAACKFHHPRDKQIATQISLNMLGLPMRQDEKSCPYYMRTWSCKFGVACKFHHPQPAAAVGTILPVPGATAYGSTGSSIAPASSVPYVAGLPAWSLPRVPSIAGPFMPSSQAYMPVVLSHSQGILPSQRWSAYTPENGSSGLGSLQSSSVQLYPDRPEQPECQYYMKTGSCKFGSACKYHHPKERPLSTANSFGQFGLPLRPGQAVCSYYSMYGQCKYGTMCKYDHPLPYYNYSMSLSAPDPILFSNQKKSPTSRSPEASPSKSHNSPDRTKSEERDTKDESPDKNAPKAASQEAASSTLDENETPTSLNTSQENSN